MLPRELNDYVRDIYLFNLRYRVLRNQVMLNPDWMWAFSSPIFSAELRMKIKIMNVKRVRKHIDAKLFYKRLKPTRFFEL